MQKARVDVANHSSKDFGQRVLALVSSIPKGKVTTYKEIAQVLGSHPRAVGQALKRNKQLIIIPCHRVVASDGSLGGYCGELHSAQKKKLLKKEGIVFDGKKIHDFEMVLYRFKRKSGILHPSSFVINPIGVHLIFTPIIRKMN